MKILHVADLHYTLKHYDWLLKEAHKYDLVVMAGDMLDIVSPVNQPTQILVVQKYIKRIVAHTKLIVSSGNHDGDHRSEHDESHADWLKRARSSGAYIDGECMSHDGILFSVFPWWDGPVSRGQVNAQMETDAAKQKDRWIWIHHAPPQDSPTAYTRKGHFGDENLRGKIVRYQPDMVLCGHIHQAPFYPHGSWVDQIGKTWIFQNGKAVGDFPAHSIIDLDEEVAVWISPYEQEKISLATPLAEQHACSI